MKARATLWQSVREKSGHRSQPVSPAGNFLRLISKTASVIRACDFHWQFVRISPRGNKYALAQKQIRPVYPRFISRAYQGQWCIAQTKAPRCYIPTDTHTHIFPPLSGPVSIYFCIGVALPRLENETNLPHGFQFYPGGGDVVTTRVSRRRVRYDPRGRREIQRAESE